jgi:F-type H+-transporting ATPase subunit delta
MKTTRASIRYAKAFLELSVEQDNLDRSYTDMLSLRSICFESKDLSLFLNSPIVKTDAKLRIFSLIFSNNFSKLSMDFLNIIISKKRENLMSGIAQSFIDLYKTHNNIDTATITTAVPISEDLRQTIINYIMNLGKKTG